MTRVTAPHDFEVLQSAMALSVAVVSGSEEARDVASELETYLTDGFDIMSDVGADERRQFQKDALDYVKKLEALGCVVSVGFESKLQLRSPFDDKLPPMSWSVGYVVIALAEDEKPLIGIERGRQVGFR